MAKPFYDMIKSLDKFKQSIKYDFNIDNNLTICDKGLLGFSDIDGILHIAPLHGVAKDTYILLEVKCDRNRGSVLPKGQYILLRSLIDSLERAGCNAILVVASHSIYDESVDIKASDLEVVKVYERHTLTSLRKSVKLPVFVGWYLDRVKSKVA